MAQKLCVRSSCGKVLMFCLPNSMVSTKASPRHSIILCIVFLASGSLCATAHMCCNDNAFYRRSDWKLERGNVQCFTSCIVAGDNLRIEWCSSPVFCRLWLWGMNCSQSELWVSECKQWSSFERSVEKINIYLVKKLCFTWTNICKSTWTNFHCLQSLFQYLL